MTKAERRAVAIVDDDYAVRDSLRFLLQIVGYNRDIRIGSRVPTGQCAPFCLPNLGPSHAEYVRLGTGRKTAC
jgi:hypothetical protein